VIEIMLGVYFTGVIFSVLTLIWFYRFTERKFRSPALARLNSNLGKIGLFWSDNRANFQLLSESSVETDQKRSRRNLIFLALFAFAGLPGFLLIFVVVISTAVLARSRKERAALVSRLASDQELSSAEVTALVEDIRKIN